MPFGERVLFALTELRGIRKSEGYRKGLQIPCRAGFANPAQGVSTTPLIPLLKTGGGSAMSAVYRLL